MREIAQRGECCAWLARWHRALCWRPHVRTRFEDFVDILIEEYQEDILEARRPPAVPPVVAMIAITQIAVGSSFQMSRRLAS